MTSASVTETYSALALLKQAAECLFADDEELELASIGRILSSRCERAMEDLARKGLDLSPVSPIMYPPSSSKFTKRVWLEARFKRVQRGRAHISSFYFDRIESDVETLMLFLNDSEE